MEGTSNCLRFLDREICGKYRTVAEMGSQIEDRSFHDCAPEDFHGGKTGGDLRRKYHLGDGMSSAGYVGIADDVR